MNYAEKEKIEKELEFLRESFESEVISEEEYLSGKARLEKQLKLLEEQAVKGSSQQKEKKNIEAESDEEKGIQQKEESEEEAIKEKITEDIKLEAKEIPEKKKKK